MLTGDNQATAEAIAKQAGIDEVFANLLPRDKVKQIAALQAEGRKVAMVGTASTMPCPGTSRRRHCDWHWYRCSIATAQIVSISGD